MTQSEAKIEKRRSETEIAEFLASEELSHYFDKIIPAVHLSSSLSFSQ
jgi:hypothetical protein